MSTIALPPFLPSSPVPAARTEPRVVACYSVIDAFMASAGIDDLTDGMYEGDASRSYEAAQARQAEVLLDRAHVGPGTRLLDIGCGYGRILEAATARGAQAVGITVSPEQVSRDTRAGLDVRLRDYKSLGREWDGHFDAVIANGSLEHFAQPADAAAGRDDAVYRRLFATVHRLLEPSAARLVTTAIHFRDRPDPHDLLRPPSDFPRGSPAFHWARLVRSYGGWYPVRGQLEACAGGLFRLIEEEDGTEDYRLTSEAWLGAMRGALGSVRGVGTLLGALPVFVRHPTHTVRMLRCTLGSESWNWQFRGDNPPAVLLRQRWERIA